MSVDAEVGAFFLREYRKEAAKQRNAARDQLRVDHDRMLEVERIMRDRRRHGLLEVRHTMHPSAGRARPEWADPDAMEAWVRRGPTWKPRKPSRPVLRLVEGVGA